MELTVKTMEAAISQVPARQELTPLKIGALQAEFIAALNKTKIFKATIDEIDKALRYCMLKVGMRANNLPAKTESEVLFNHLLKFYGNLSVHELRLAFDLATSGKIEVPETFENFSCSYLSKVLNAYKVWAAKAYNENRAEIEKPRIETVHSSTDWRESVQAAYQNFIKGKVHYKLWLPEMYDQLVEDDLIRVLFYKKFIESSRKELCEETHHQIVQLEIVIEKDVSKISLHKDLQNKLVDYRNGNQDKEVLLLAKQTAILKYFEWLKSKSIPAIYVKG